MVEITSENFEKEFDKEYYETHSSPLKEQLISEIHSFENYDEEKSTIWLPSDGEIYQIETDVEIEHYTLILDGYITKMHKVMELFNELMASSEVGPGVGVSTKQLDEAGWKEKKFDFDKDFDI